MHVEPSPTVAKKTCGILIANVVCSHAAPKLRKLTTPEHPIATGSTQAVNFGNSEQ